MKDLKQKILENIPQYSPENIAWGSIDEFSHLSGSENGYITSDAVIQAALDKYKCVKIDKRAALYLAKPIIMRSGYRLLLDKNQVISNIPGKEQCLIRNENIENGFRGAVLHQNPDTDISVDGGIWDAASLRQDARLGTGDTDKFLESAMSVMIFSNAENIIVRNAEFKNGGSSYALQICNVSHFSVSNLTFIKYGRDGVHVNGPASFGEIHDLKGLDMGDDMIAINAWDWDVSAITYGTVEYMYIHDNESQNNEFRLLPGRKMYEDSYVDCDIRNMIIEKLSGIYTFKLYCQPNIENAITKGYNDVSGTVGRIYNVYFKDIVINEKKSGGFHDLPTNGIFDVCADCNDIYFENISVDFDKSEFDKINTYFMSVGPLSATWKNDSDNPDDWGEVFSPDDICTVDNIHMKNITFKDGKVTDAKQLVREVHLTLNADYPHTTPKGGTGYGIVKTVTVE